MPSRSQFSGAFCLLPPRPGRKPSADATALAGAAYMICGKPNGYRVPIYGYPKRCGHADCIEESYRQAVFRLIDGLARLAVKQYLAGSLPAASAEEQLEEGGRPASSAPNPTEGSADGEGWPPRFMLPEFDIDVTVESGSRRRRKSPAGDRGRAPGRGS